MAIINKQSDRLSANSGIELKADDWRNRLSWPDEVVCREEGCGGKVGRQRSIIVVTVGDEIKEVEKRPGLGGETANERGGVTVCLLVKIIEV